MWTTPPTTISEVLLSFIRQLLKNANKYGRGFGKTEYGLIWRQWTDRRAVCVDRSNAERRARRWCFDWSVIFTRQLHGEGHRMNMKANNEDIICWMWRLSTCSLDVMMQQTSFHSLASWTESIVPSRSHFDGEWSVPGRIMGVVFPPVCLQISQVPSSLWAPLVGVGSGTQSPGRSFLEQKEECRGSAVGASTCRRPSRLPGRPPRAARWLGWKERSHVLLLREPLYLHVNRYQKKSLSWQRAACGVRARKAVLDS